MENKFSICLNMIVKDESHIILDTLENLCSKIHFNYWVICDTGSSDNTKEIIKTFFDNKNITGELHSDEWLDFGHNRSLALERAFNKSDYVLIFDADDKIVGELVFPENIFNYDAYYLTYGETVKYDRIQLVNNRKRWKYIGVLHEYIECLEKNTTNHLNGNYYIISGKCGNRSKCNDKYIKDALTLEKAYETALNNGDNIYMRYSFYCANSYKDANDTCNAIKWYKNTLTLNNWTQEKYICCLNLYDLYDKKKEIENGIYYLIQSHKYDNARVEGIYHLVKHYCIHNHNEMSYLFYTLIQDYYENTYIKDTFCNKLFISESDYSFFLPYYMIIVSERLKKYDIGLKMYDIIFTKQNVSVGEWWIKNLVFNLQFFIEKNTEFSFVKKWRHYLQLINEQKYKIDYDLVNRYEIYNVSNYLDTYSQNDIKSENKNETDNVELIMQEKVLYDDDSFIVIAILAKDKESVLPFYLHCIYNQTYNKKYIHLYIRTNDNNDNTNSILTEFIEKYGNEYASVYFDNSSISETLKQYTNHEWNSFRFSILGKIRQDSVDYALKLNAHYFVADCDNFIIPTTIEKLIQNKECGVISPILRTPMINSLSSNINYNNPSYSNYHYDVDKNGYYKYNDKYFTILNNDITGLVRVCCLHCAYFIPKKYLSLVKYNDGTNRYEYVIFSETLRKQNVPQYMDNTNKYGFLTFAETKDEFEIEYEYNKNKYSFIEL